MIDLHAHILPGLDDGPKTWEESLAMARLAAADGITTMVATPHLFQHRVVEPGQFNSREKILAAVAELRERPDYVLKVAKCNNSSCTLKTVSTADDPVNHVGFNPSIAIGADGFPVISYQDGDARSLVVAKCNDNACAGGGETITTVDDPVNEVGSTTSIAVGADGYPVVAYHDYTAGTLKVAKCNDPARAPGGETITTVDDPANNVGFFTSIRIGADGLPVISYQDSTAGTLKVAKCNDPACAGGDDHGFGFQIYFFLMVNFIFYFGTNPYLKTSLKFSLFLKLFYSTNLVMNFLIRSWCTKKEEDLDVPNLMLFGRRGGICPAG